MAERKGFGQIWPAMVDTQTAREGARQGVVASACNVGVTVFFAFSSLFGSKIMGSDIWNLVDAGFFMIIGWGIYKLSRIAAVAGLCLYLVERVYMWAILGYKNPVITILLTLMFVNAVRGTFAFHRFSRTAVNVEG